jgi:hypothetical protein
MVRLRVGCWLGRTDYVAPSVLLVASTVESAEVCQLRDS